MKPITLTAGIMLLCFGLPVSSQAQWPLGKELGQVPQKSEPGPHLTATGRFQIFITPNIKGHTFMLDTETGKIWEISKDSSSGGIAAKRIPVEEADVKQADAAGSGTPSKVVGGRSEAAGRKGP
jgi:hypothetical protein